MEQYCYSSVVFASMFLSWNSTVIFFHVSELNPNFVTCRCSEKDEKIAAHATVNNIYLSANFKVIINRIDINFAIIDLLQGAKSILLYFIWHVRR